MQKLPHVAWRRLNTLFSEIETLYHDAALRLGLSDSAMRVLYTICELGQGCSLSQVYKRSGTSRQTIHSAVRKLEGEGVVRLEAQNGRSKALFLTEKGFQVVETQVKPLIDMENAVFARWEETDRREHLHLTERLLSDLRREFDGMAKGENQ